MSKSKKKKKSVVTKFTSSDANISLTSGATLGAIGIAEAAALGIVCPVCVAGACGFIGYGIYRKIKDNKSKSKKTKHPLTVQI